jgi:hypothetical protein
MISALQRDIIDGLSESLKHAAIVRRLKRCQTGACKTCGDVCAIKGCCWKGANFAAIVSLFESINGAPVFDVRVTREEWVQPRGSLAGAGLAKIEKGIRRAFDDFRSPRTVAVGQMDAWWDRSRWEIGARFLVIGPPKQALFGFSWKFRTEIIEVADIAKTLAEILDAVHLPKLHPLLVDGGELPNRKRRAEYYRWLCTLKPGSRVFRYGCNRYFQKLEKKERPVRERPKEAHPWPRWLEPFQFGNHAPRCLCIPCGGPGLHFNRPSIVKRRVPKAEVKRYFDDV